MKIILAHNLLALSHASFDALSTQVLDCNPFDLVVGAIVRGEPLSTTVVHTDWFIDVGARICVGVRLLVILLIIHARLYRHQLFWRHHARVSLIKHSIFRFLGQAVIRFDVERDRVSDQADVILLLLLISLLVSFLEV